MGENEVSASVIGNLTDTQKDFEVKPQTTDGATEQKETTWMNEDWEDQLGFYNEIPEVMAVTDAKSAWTVGSGYETDDESRTILDGIRGINGDTFLTFLENMIRTSEIGGNSYAQIIRDKDGELINLKPLNPGSMRHHANRKGIIIRFEQISRLEGATPKKFQPNEILYFSRNRVADEIHGNTMITRLASIILARNEAMADQKEVFHRFVRPRWIIKLDTDDKTKIEAEKKKWDSANEKGENMYIPMGSVEVEQMAISPNSTLNPQTWIDNLNNYFYEASAVPKIIVGGSGGFTDAAVKIAMLAFEQNIRKKALYVEEQIGMQLGIELKIIFPVSLQDDLLSGIQKDGAVNIDQSDVIPTPAQEVKV